MRTPMNTDGAGRTVLARAATMTVALVMAASLSVPAAAAQEVDPVPAGLGLPSAGPGVIGDEVNQVLEAVRAKTPDADSTHDRPTLAEQVIDHVDECRDAVRNADRWNAGHDVRRDCVTGPVGTSKTTVREIRQHAGECWGAARATPWELLRDVRRECVRQPAATVLRWLGVDIPYAGWSAGVVA